ncbi:MAG: DUF6513 domain-containing protein [Gemmatimonadales bacterium]|nr:DUF6513 domain-containing protein [Gemmatimonadales bacterium]
MTAGGEGGAPAPAHAPVHASARRVLFVTGRLAEPALRRSLARAELPFAWDVAVLPITVAALMTTPWIARHLAPAPEGTDLVLLPGLCEGELAPVEAVAGVAVAKGPKDLRQIPRWFGGQAVAEAYGAFRIRIVAEINNASRWEEAAFVAEAERLARDGADWIDVGCTPGKPFPALAARVAALRARGLRVSVDSFDPDEIRAAVGAGAELVLSVNGSNLAIARELAGRDVRVVAIPDFGQGLDTLERTVAQLDDWGVPCWLDPILEPIGYGFFRSLERFADVARRFPGRGQMMGIGNLTELTAADTTGVNAILVAIAEELGVEAVLTTEVISWARGSVREIDVARRLMHYAVAQQQVPKRVDDRLVTVKDPEVLSYTEDELRALHAEVTDPNFRIFADREAITVFNRDVFVRGTDIQGIFEQLGVDEASHAFYLGKELARAKLAVELGKTYRQEGALQWGYLTPPDDPRREHRKLTMRSRRGDGAAPA